MNPVLQDETQFLAWGDGPQGPWIKLKLRDSDDLTPFRGMTAAKATQAGQRLACVLVEIGDDEQPKPATDKKIAETAAEAVKGGALSQFAARLCLDPVFQQWIEKHHADTAGHVPADRLPEDRAASIIRGVCSVRSRAELDHDAPAAEIFHAAIRKPWLAYCEGLPA